MIGGTVVQVVPDGTYTFVEVLENTYFDRVWRIVAPRGGAKPYPIKSGDSLWWQSGTGYLSRRDANDNVIFQDIVIGSCRPADSPLSSERRR